MLVTLRFQTDEALTLMHALRNVATNPNLSRPTKLLLAGVADRIATQALPSPERERLIDALSEHMPDYDHKDLQALCDDEWQEQLANMSDDELRAEYADRCGDDEDYGKPAPTGLR